MWTKILGHPLSPLLSSYTVKAEDFTDDPEQTCGARCHKWPSPSGMQSFGRMEHLRQRGGCCVRHDPEKASVRQRNRPNVFTSRRVTRRGACIGMIDPQRSEAKTHGSQSSVSSCYGSGQKSSPFSRERPRSCALSRFCSSRHERRRSPQYGGRLLLQVLRYSTKAINHFRFVNPSASGL